MLAQDDLQGVVAGAADGQDELSETDVVVLPGEGGGCQAKGATGITARILISGIEAVTCEIGD